MDNKVRATFEQYFKNHKATVILDDGNFLIFDWRNQNGSGEYYVRYILDKKRGCLMVSGDLGDCISCWYNELAAKNVARHITDIGYWMGKFQCASDTYTYRDEDCKEDLMKIRDEYLEDEEMLWSYYKKTAKEVRNDFDEMLSIIDYGGISQDGHYSQELIDHIEQYEEKWYEGSWSDIGKRVSSRVYLWAIGYQMAIAQIME